MAKTSVRPLTFFLVTPSYNQGKFIDQTIRSVLDQTYPDLVYWVMDGGSQDETISILKRYQGQLHFRSAKDKGQSDALNTALREFKKQPAEVRSQAIFAYLNSDDYLLPGALEAVAKAFAEHPNSQWVVGEYVISSAKSNWFHSLLVVTWKKILKLFYSRDLLLILNPIAQPATFIKWSAIEQLGDFDESLKYTMDYEYWLRLQHQIGNPYFLPQVIAAFRIHPASKGGSAYRAQFAEQEQVSLRYRPSRMVHLLQRAHSALAVFLYSIFK